jgi:hypothetical protein
MILELFLESEHYMNKGQIYEPAKGIVEISLILQRLPLYLVQPFPESASSFR